MDTALLRAFVAVAEERHFGRAAQRLFITQQALSKRISRLEGLVGTRLLDRTGRDVVLNELGEQLLPLARGIVEDVDAAVAEIRPPTRPLRVDVLDEHLALLAFARAIADESPGEGTGTSVDVVMRQYQPDATSLLHTGDADVSFGRAGVVPDPWPKEIEYRTALLEPIGLLLGAAHPWASRDSVGVKELYSARLWFPMTGPPHEWRTLLDELRDGFSLTIDYGGSTMGFDRFVSKATEVTSLYGLAMPPPPHPDARVVPIVDPVPVFAWTMMWRRRLPSSARIVADAIVNRARAATAEPHPAEAWMPASDRALLTDPYR